MHRPSRATLTTVALVASLVACGGRGRSEDPRSLGVPAIQDAIEHGLLPAVQVRGEVRVSSLDERMAKLHIPGLSIAVFDGYRLVWAKAYGMADVEGGQPVTASTLFQAGSISKSVNALAVLEVVADGVLALDAPINGQLRTWKLPDNELTAKAGVTLRRLLSHTAGTTVHGFPGYAAGAPVPTLVQVLDGAPPANTAPIRVDLEPGTGMRYSGGGITITQLALVDNLGAAYPTILHDRVLAPLEMQASTYEQPLPGTRLADAAAGYHADGTVVPGKRHVYPEMAAAGLWTTPTDLAKFFLELCRARAGKSTRVSRELAVQMTTAVETKAHAGLGVFVMDRNGTTTFGHGGADEGFQADAVASLDGGFGLVVMANSDNGFELFPEIERTVFAAMQWPGADLPIERVALAPDQRARLVGRFVREDGLPFAITADGDKLAFAIPFGAPTDLIAVGPDVLVSAADGARFAFSDAGTRIAFSLAGAPSAAAVRLDGAAFSPLFELAAGHFDAAVAAWSAAIKARPDAPELGEELHNLYGYELMQAGEREAARTIFRAIVAVFPDSSNAYDSYGEALMAVGDKPGAIAAYEASLARLDGDPKIPADAKAGRRAHAEAQLAILRAP